ncbi:endolytic transglycosylase MltG [Bacillus ginsengihumi]|uniref:Endolytic transglycosylase MltG n=1 Tax=Heyndrickxia ginsengihumi TaxID=363870 RepID=A0A6M0P802_9BACI|nr:endolytic transglycosylase MltG [Heyndrickxia ginsengihumi]NEY20030.1 endolytic transglycosylase MltG [Heyndrickxia ginsengihumi]
MNKQTTRAFAFGLLIAALLILACQPLFSTNTSHVKKGYLVIKKSEYDQLQKQNQQLAAKNKQLLSQTSKKASETKKHKEIVRYHLSVTKGMTTMDISKRLKTGEIIKDEKQFSQYLIAHDYQKQLQIGEYDLTNQMSFEQIAKMITKTAS